MLKISVSFPFPAMRYLECFRPEETACRALTPSANRNVIFVLMNSICQVLPHKTLSAANFKAMQIWTEKGNL